MSSFGPPVGDKGRAVTFLTATSVCWDQSVTSLTRREGDSDVTSLPPSVGGRKRSVPSALPAPPGTPRRPSMGGGDDCGAPTTPPSWGPQLPAGDGDHCDPHITS